MAASIRVAATAAGWNRRAATTRPGRTPGLPRGTSVRAGGGAALVLERPAGRFALAVARELAGSSGAPGLRRWGQRHRRGSRHERRARLCSAMNSSASRTPWTPVGRTYSRGTRTTNAIEVNGTAAGASVGLPSTNETWTSSRSWSMPIAMMFEPGRPEWPCLG